MATYETEPTTTDLYDHEERSEKNEYEKVEAIYIGGGNKPTYMVGKDDVWTADNYLCIRVAKDGHEQEIHKIPHERVSRRKYVVKQSVSEEVATSNLKDTANAEVLD